MTRKEDTERLSAALETLVSEARTPPDAAERALARARRRRVTKWAGGATTVAAVASLIAVLAVVQPPPLFDDGGGRAGGCEATDLAAYLSRPADGSAPTAHVYDWQAPRCQNYRRTEYAWAVDSYGQLAVLGEAGDQRGQFSPATRELGILSPKEDTERWVTLPAPTWAAYWSPDDGHRILASLMKRDAGGNIVYSGYVIVDPSKAKVTSTVTFDEPALTPVRWAPDSKHVIASFGEEVRFFNLDGKTTRELSVQGLVTTGAPLSPDGQRLLLQRPGDVGSGRYVVVSVDDGTVTRRVNVDGKVVTGSATIACCAPSTGKRRPGPTRSTLPRLSTSLKGPGTPSIRRSTN